MGNRMMSGTVFYSFHIRVWATLELALWAVSSRVFVVGIVVIVAVEVRPGG